ncbi:MAG: APC family permease [Acidiphilium sp.]|nr:APC family permease [Acidiphilium sp.]MDD4936105.1 APC family permease [Acidiphilium sp.]
MSPNSEFSPTADLADLTAAPTPANQLRHGTLSLLETIGQSIANIAPTLTPALNISVVAGFAGVDSWLSYLIGTIGIMLVASGIGSLAARHPQAGSYFVYIGRTLGPFAGGLAGWSMISAYLMTGVAVVLGFPIFLGNFLAVLGIKSTIVPLWVFAIAFFGMVTYAAYRDIKFSSRVGLLLEAISVGIIIVITAMIIGIHGTVIDPVELNFSNLKYGAVMNALPFVVFSFVGFESAATLAKESSNPSRNIPRSVVFSAAIAGLFFTLIAYFMVFGIDNNAAAIGNSASPFAAVTDKAGLPWAAGVVYFAAMISAFACALACVNAGARMLFSMGRYQFLHGSVGMVHKTHQTPHVAVLVSAGIIMAITLATMPLGYLNAFGYTGTIATFGFLVVYFTICIVAPMDLKKAGLMKPRHVLVGIAGVALMTFVIFGSVYPVPAYPYNILPYLFLGYMVFGALWFAMLRARSPQILQSIVLDMEG